MAEETKDGKTSLQYKLAETSLEDDLGSLEESLLCA